MAFLDNLGVKISQTGQATAQKTKDLMDITKLNTMIADEEKKINNQYFRIGKQYVALYSAEPHEELSGMIDAILESEAKIREHKLQIQDIKGVQSCVKCGAEVSKESAFCVSCGNPMPRAQIPVNTDVVKCEGCGAMVKKGMKFCTSCGRPMNLTAPPVVQEQVIEKKTCPNCGVEVAEGIAFCFECGKPISKEQAPEAQDTVKCDVCGTMVKQGMKFCTTCGNPMIAAAPKVAEQPVLKLRTCPYCGVIITEDTAFCIECGNKL